MSGYVLTSTTLNFVLKPLKPTAFVLSITKNILTCLNEFVPALESTQLLKVVHVFFFSRNDQFESRLSGGKTCFFFLFIASAKNMANRSAT